MNTECQYMKELVKEESIFPSSDRVFECSVPFVLAIRKMLWGFLLVHFTRPPLDNEVCFCL